MGGDLQEDKFLLVQFPSILPELVDPSEEIQREQEDDASAGAGASITRLPDGLLGKLRIHKSGKVRMEIGGVPFCLDPGSATFFHQELACVCPLANEIVNLGPIRNRVVATPDIDAMFRDMEREAAAKEAAAAHVKAIEGMNAKGVLTQGDYAAINAGLGKAIASVPTSKVMDVYNSMAKLIGDSPVPNKLFSTVNPNDAQAAYNALLEFKDVVKAQQR